MKKQTKNTSASGNLWHCDDCQVWWGSQVGEQVETLFLLQLPESLANRLSWIDYRGWKSTGLGASICPQCNTGLAEPTFSSC